MAKRFAAMIFVALIYPNLVHAQHVERGPESKATISKESGSPVVGLLFKEFFDTGASELRPSRKLLSLTGRHVRLIGFMTQMQDPPLGAFYLCPRPILADESGSGTADLPPESVLVIVTSSQGKKISFIPGALEIVGILEVGRREETDGRVSFIRLVLDKPEETRSVSPSTHHRTRPRE